jgi:sirohydrochlorin ferrochelatase
MKCLLIVAHGSRRQASNEEVQCLGAAVAAQLGGDFSSVHTAFLEFASPSISVGLERCIEQGADEIVVLPYFLSAGNHVINDLPAEIKPMLAEQPQAKITLLPHIGSGNGMLGLITSMCA